MDGGVGAVEDGDIDDIVVVGIGIARRLEVGRGEEAQVTAVAVDGEQGAVDAAVDAIGEGIGGGNLIRCGGGAYPRGGFGGGGGRGGGVVGGGGV